VGKFPIEKEGMQAERKFQEILVLEEDEKCNDMGENEGRTVEGSW
jgi:hypothetical protein